MQSFGKAALASVLASATAVLVNNEYNYGDLYDPLLQNMQPNLIPPNGIWRGCTLDGS